MFLGLCVKSGIDHFTDKDRKVVVKGLAEKEVPADKVTWPIVSKELGNDLPQLYQRIAVTQAQIRRFLNNGGIKDAEISVNAPVVIDMNANQYSDNKRVLKICVWLASLDSGFKALTIFCKKLSSGAKALG